MQLDLSIVITIGIQITAIGVFMGTTRTALKTISDRLERIEDKQDKQNEEIVELRERVAVIESTLEIKRKNH